MKRILAFLALFGSGLAVLFYFEEGGAPETVEGGITVREGVPPVSSSARKRGIGIRGRLDFVN